MIILWIGVILGSLIGFSNLLMGTIAANGAPQQAAAAAMGAAWAVIPYCFVRAISEIIKR